MSSSLDRVADLFENDEARTILVSNLPEPLAPYPFSELARAASHRDDDSIPREVHVLGRELRRAGLAIHRANTAGERAPDDHVDLLAYVRSATDWWASTVDHDGPGLVTAHLIDPCATYLEQGRGDDRDDAYAVLRALATLLRSHSGFQLRWTLEANPHL
ncbi:hypothetical protein ACI3K5_23375 [Streptomyces sp. MPA0124]|uniref:hypothetical protein n=1 Tax=Streptomyces sp. MPA0124 TaxID=3378069 RepID=UPI003853CF77